MLLWKGQQSSAQQACYLPNLSWYPFIHLGWEEQVPSKVPCSRIQCMDLGNRSSTIELCVSLLLQSFKISCAGVWEATDEKWRKTTWNWVKMAKIGWISKKKAEILAKEHFQKKWGNQLKRGTLTPLLVLSSVASYPSKVPHYFFNSPQLPKSCENSSKESFHSVKRVCGIGHTYNLPQLVWINLV